MMDCEAGTPGRLLTHGWLAPTVKLECLAFYRFPATTSGLLQARAQRSQGSVVNCPPELPS